MHHLLPSHKSTSYNLRTLGHGLSINQVKSELHKIDSLIDSYLTIAVDFCLLCLYCVLLSLFVLLVCMFHFCTANLLCAYFISRV